ncbi:MAG: hypothetical protein ACRDY1_09635 [Acidimicrobiales bacterium]
MQRGRFSTWLIAVAAVMLAIAALTLNGPASAASRHSVTASGRAAHAPLAPPCPGNSAQCNGGHLLSPAAALFGGLVGSLVLAVTGVVLRRRRSRPSRDAGPLPDGVRAGVLRPPRISAITWA